MSTIALMGAGGKVGIRITRNMKGQPDFKMLHVEISEAGLAGLADLGMSTTPQDEALEQAELLLECLLAF